MKKSFRFVTVLIMAVILSSVAFASPGLNLLTGTTEAQTFDDMTTLPSTIQNAVLDDSPFEGEDGKVLRNQYSYNTTSSYATVGFTFAPALDRNRPYQISFKAYKWAEEGYGVTNTQLWIMKNGTAGWQIAKNIGSFTAGKTSWYKHNYTVTTFGSLTNTSTGLLDESDISTIYFEWQYDSAASMNTTEKVYFDDISIIPAYKITYLDEDGDEIKSEYKVITEKTFTPDVLPSDKEMGIIGWSKKNDGTADETISLNNEDVTLYAVYDNTLRINLSADKTLLVESGDTANLSTNLWHRNGTDGITASYSVAEGSSYVTLSDNGNGTATVTAKGEGMAKIVCTASTGESEYIYVLCDYQSVEKPEVVQTVPTISASNWLYDHQGATFNETEGAWEVTKRTDVLKPDGTTYYNNGFLNKTVNADTSVYKYALFKLKADRTTNFQVAITVNGAWKYTYPSASATNGEYVVVSADINALASGGTAGALVIGVTNHHDTVYIKDITLSNIPTYEAEIPEVKSIKVVKSVSEISDDAGVADVEAAIFTNKGSGASVAWKSSSDCIAIKNLGYGKAQLKAMSDGTATITAYAEGDETVSESFTVTVSGQREKQAVYDIRILFWGASTTKHAPSASLGWYGDWGMAASAEENDYVHKLVSYLEEEFYPSKVTFEVVASSALDQELSKETNTTRDWTNFTQYVEIEGIMKDLKPNIIVTAMTGNMSASTSVDVAYNAYKQFYDMMYAYCPDAIVVAQHCGLSCVTRNDQLIAKLDKDYSDKIFYDYHVNPTMKLDPANLAPEFENSGVAAHWGDKGHNLVATTCFGYIAPEVPANIEADYIYIPEEIEITGDTKVDEKGASLQLAVKVTPNDASADVVWSIDNSNIALISKNGLLSPLSNGTVVVTAKSAYNDEIYDTHTVVITNQLDNFTLTYASGTTDTVTGLPEADEYATGNYVLSNAIPLRDAYTFVGWGLTENAEETVTSVNMTKPTTVYAIWKKTDGFEFEGTYDENNGFIYGFSIENGFHNNVSDGSLWTTCTAGAKVTFKTPVIDVDADYLSFGLSSAYTDENGKVELTVKTADSEKTFIYPLTSKNYTTYVADTSSLSGNITGVEIYVNTVPADSTMFDIALDFIRFVPVRSADEGEFIVSNGAVTVSNLAYDGYTAIEADEEAIFVVTLDGGYSYEFKNTSAIYAAAEEGEMFTVNVLSYNAAGSSSYKESAMNVYSGTKKLTDMSTLTTYDTASLRTTDPTGLRVKASVGAEFYLLDNVKEYGYAIAREDSVTSGKINDVILKQEYIDAKSVVYGAAYNESEGIHKIYEKDDTTEFFTAVLTNIPQRKDALMTSLVFRPYVKLNDGSILYGAKVTRTVYDVAISVYYRSDSDETAKAAAKAIIDICGDPFGNDIGIDLDDLYKD